VLALLVAGTAAGQGEPAESYRARAAAEFNLGLNAYEAGRYEEAAKHFEAADEAVPSAEALRAMLSARQKAGQIDRATTLAAQAQRRYPKEAKLQKLASDVLAAHASELHRLQVTCSKECTLEVAGERVPGPAVREADVYAAPGRVTVHASFPGGGEADEQVLMARAGGTNSLHFIARSKAKPAAAAPAASAPSPSSAATGKSAPPAAPAPDETEAQPQPTGPAEPDASSGWSPAVFFVALGATAVLGGVTIWSGVDTLNSPGEESVREACRGLGTDCPEYQTGLEKELRTNVLIAATAGIGVLTGVIGLFLTDWGSGEEGAEAAVRVEPSRDHLLGLNLRY
jgi:hypothetical protein